MPLKSATVDALGIATLALTLLICCVGVFCVIYVLRFRIRINRRGRFYALRDFNSPWRVRIILVCFGVFWILTELLRLPLLRTKGWLFYSFSFQWQANLCRLYALLSLGFSEPCFFLTALFLVRGSLREAPFTPRRRWDSKVIALVLSFCFPVFLLQLFFLVITPALEFHKRYEVEKEGYGKIPAYFTRAFQEIRLHDRRVAACSYPLFSSLVLALFALNFFVYFLYLAWRMILVVINRKLQIRIYSLVLAFVVLLPMHAMFLALSVLSTPGEDLYEAIAFIAFLTVVMCATVGAWILVIRPISDALAVPWVSETMGSWQHSWGALPIENLSAPLCLSTPNRVEDVRNISENNLHGISSFQTDPNMPGGSVELPFSQGKHFNEASTSKQTHYAH